jgi:hypothetical protein
MADVFTRESTKKIKRAVDIVLGDPGPVPPGGSVPERRPVNGMRIGKTSEAISKSSTGSVDLHSRGASHAPDYSTTKGEEASTGNSVEAYARLGDVETGKWVYVQWIDNGWEIINAEC